MARTAQELYGMDVDTNSWKTKAYEEVLLLKRKLSAERIKALDKAHMFWRDFNNITACKEADRHNDMLLEEIGSFYEE